MFINVITVSLLGNSMRAAFLNARNLHFRIHDVEIPTKSDGEALLGVEACGICGTDLHMYRQRFETWKNWKNLALMMARRAGLLRRHSSFGVFRPGHEICGVVKEATRQELDNKKVVAFPTIPCGTCWPCQHGVATACEHFSNIGFERAGGFAEYVTVPQNNLIEVPKTLDSRVATLAEPMACGLHAVDIAEAKKNDNVLVLGGGTMGQLITHICSTKYASEVVTCDPNSFRLKTARELGAADTIKPDEMMSKEKFPDIVFDCVGGHSQTINPIVDIIRPRGTICILGIHHGAKPIKLRRLQMKEVKIKTSQGSQRRNQKDAVTRIECYQNKLGVLVTHSFSLEKISEAFLVAAKHKLYNALKVVVKP